MEVLVSVSLISIGVLGLLTILPSGWRLSGTSDFIGRAAGILQGELEENEILIMNGNNTVPPADPADPSNPPATKFVYGSRNPSGQAGDIRYTVRTERTQPVALGGSWLVRVQVTWPSNATGIQESLVVTRQSSFNQ